MDVYKVGISMVLQNGVSAGLRLIMRDLGGVMGNINKINKGTQDWRAGLIAVGAAMSASGIGVLSLYERVVKAGDKIVKQQAVMRSLGVGNSGVNAMTAAAWKTATTVSGVSIGDVLKDEVMLRSITGSNSGAAAILTDVEKAKAYLGSALGGNPDESLSQALKAIDIVGGANKGGHISPEELVKNLGYIERAMVLSHGQITGSAILRMVQQAGPAATQIPFKDLLSNYTEAVMALGPAVGRGLFTSYMVASVGRAPAVAAHYLTQYGLVDPAKMQKIKGSSTYLFNPNDLLGADYLKKNGMLDWVREIVLPKLASQGVTTRQQQIAALSGMFSASTSARLLSFIANNGPQIDRYKALSAMDGGDPYNQMVKGDWNLAVTNFSTSWGNLIAALGAPAVKGAISALNSFSDGIHNLTLWLSQHPGWASALDQGLLAFGAAITGFGVVLAGAGVVALIGTGGTLAAIAAGVSVFAAALAALNWKQISDAATAAVQAVGNGIEWLVQKLRIVTDSLGITSPTYRITPDQVSAALQPHMLPMGATHASAGMDIPVPGVPFWQVNNAAQAVHVSNPQDIARAVKSGLAGALGGNQTGPTGFNGRSSPFGSPAFAGP